MNDYSNIIIAISTAVVSVIAIGRMLGTSFAKIDTKFDKIDTKFDKIDAKFDKIDAELKEMRKEIVTELKEMRKEMVNFDKRILTIELSVDHPNLKLHKDEDPQEN